MLDTILTDGTENGATVASKVNAAINQLNSIPAMIDSKQLATAWVSFDGTGADGNDCAIHSSFNVTKVEKISTGLYRVVFSSLDNSDYLVLGETTNWSASSTNTSVMGIHTTDSANPVEKSATAVQISFHRTADDVLDNRSIMGIVVFGGKA